jgi:hypothetical protein
MDFSFNNPLIKAYFEGSDDYAPTSELMYIHTHPLVTPNFLAEIEHQVLVTAHFMLDKGMKGNIQNRFVNLAQRLGTLLPVEESGASEALRVLRELHQFCNKITATK